MLYYEISTAYRVTQTLAAQTVSVGKGIIIEYRFDKSPLALVAH